MDFETIMALIFTVGLFIYLTYAMLKPEKF